MEEAFRGEVLIDIRPMYSEPAAGYPPILTVLRGCLQQSRIPGKRG